MHVPCGWYSHCALAGRRCPVCTSHWYTVGNHLAHATHCMYVWHIWTHLFFLCHALNIPAGPLIKILFFLNDFISVAVPLAGRPAGCMHALCMHACLYACMYASMYAFMHVCMYACLKGMHVCNVRMISCVHMRLYASFEDYAWGLF